MDKYVIAPPDGSTNNSVGAADRHWGKGYFDELPGYNEYLKESTGYGIVSGCTPSISGLTVTVASGVVHLANGTRKEISASAVTLDAADPTNPRIDLVYIDSTGTVAKVTGTAAVTPSVPALPANGISVAQVSVAANASVGTLTDMRGMLLRWYNSGVVNVRDFGAVGDGVTDDTAAIQAAIDSGKTVIGNPNEIYYVANNIKGRGNLVNINFNFALYKGISYSLSNATNVIISGCKFITIGENTDPYNRGDYVLDLNNVKGAVVENCYFYNNDSNIHMSNAENITICNNVFEHSMQTAVEGGGNGYGIVFFACKNIKITNNSFIDVQRHGIYVSIVDTGTYADVVNKNVFIDNNYFTTPNKPEGDYYLDMTQPLKIMGGDSVIVTNNIFDDTYSAILLDDVKLYDMESVMDNIIISNNVFKNCISKQSRGIIHSAGGVKTGGGYSICSLNVSNNTFYISSSYPSSICVIITHGKDLVIDGNSVINNYNGETVSTLVRLYGSHSTSGEIINSLKIINNTCTNSGLFLVSGTDGYSYGNLNTLVISDNTTALDNVDLYAISISATNKISQLKVKDNYWLGTSRGIRIQPTEKGDMILEGNTATSAKKYELNSSWASGTVYTSHNLNFSAYTTYPNLTFTTDW